jgi:hypothetical protein
MGWVSFLEIKEILSIPSNVEFIAYLTLGYVTKFPERPELEEKGWNYRLPLSEVIFEDRWAECFFTLIEIFLSVYNKFLLINNEFSRRCGLAQKGGSRDVSPVPLESHDPPMVKG